MSYLRTRRIWMKRTRRVPDLRRRRMSSMSRGWKESVSRWRMSNTSPQDTSLEEGGVEE